MASNGLGLLVLAALLVFGNSDLSANNFNLFDRMLEETHYPSGALNFCVPHTLFFGCRFDFFGRQRRRIFRVTPLS